MGKNVRMADIAQKLNISVVSVSKALSGKSGVSAEMRARIIDTAKEIGYNIKTSRETAEGNIGVLVSERFFSENTFYTKLYRALLLNQEKEQFTCMMEIVSREAERQSILPDIVTAQKADGVIFMGSLDRTYMQTVSNLGLPCLLLDFYTTDGGWNCITSDNFNGGYALTQHLLATGRQNIGFVGSVCATSSIMDRYSGYQFALRSHGIIPREDWLLEDRDQNGELLPIKLPDAMPQAFVCSCDEVAYNLLELLKTQGFSVPEDVAVCGYDDFYFATLSRPQLTTYRVNVDRMAEITWLRMHQMLLDRNLGPVGCTVPGQLVVRGSC